jgi:pyruvate dehydrogenase E1 component beta subunit
MARLNMVDAIDQALLQAMERDPKIVVMGEDVGRDGGVFRVTDGLMQRFGEQRVIDTPLAESGIIGMAIGMAIAGFHPVAEIQFAGFSYPAYDQIVSHASRMRNRSRGEFTVPLVVRMPYGGGIRALEHHSESMEAIYAHVPGLKVVIPADPYQAKGLLTAALEDPDPVVFLEPARVYRAIKTEVPEDSYVLPLGKARVVREGRDVTLIAWGAQVRTVKEAAEQLQAEGAANAEVIDVCTLSPFDFQTVIDSVIRTGRAVIVHEAPKTCGFGAEISAEIMERAVLHLLAPVMRVAGFDTIPPLAKLEDYYQPDTAMVVDAVKSLMQF